MKKPIKIIIAVVLAALITTGVLLLSSELLKGITITIGKSMNNRDQYIESVSHVLTGLYVSARDEQRMTEVTETCEDFYLNFKEEHKNDTYHIEADISFDEGKTIVTYHGTITDGETKKTENFEETIAFDYIYTRDIQT